jgi:molybdopterin-guanine dinucleotide biosynthesis protein MobB
VSAAADRVLPPVVAVIGRRNSGKTTLLVQLAAELKRRGLRVASIKHSHHDVEFDTPGKDSWRHFHEGGVEAVLLASPGRVALVARAEGDDHDPLALVRRFHAGQGYDLVLVEAFKHAHVPKIEIFRRAAHPLPLYGNELPAAPARGTGSAQAGHIAIVTDVPLALDAAVPIIPLREDGGHVAAAADLLVGVLTTGGG